MALAKQLSKLPTNKLLTGSVSAAVIAGAWSDFWSGVWPVLATDNISTLAAMGIGIGLGYLVPDRVNEPL